MTIMENEIMICLQHRTATYAKVPETSLESVSLLCLPLMASSLPFLWRLYRHCRYVLTMVIRNQHCQPK